MIVAIWGALRRVFLRLMQPAIWYFSRIKNLQNLLNQYEPMHLGYILNIHPCTMYPSGNSKQVIFRTPSKTSSIVTISAYTKLAQVTVGSGHHLLSRKKFPVYNHLLCFMKRKLLCTHISSSF